jgi:hypothetical protein
MDRNAELKARIEKVRAQRESKIEGARKECKRIAKELDLHYKITDTFIDFERSNEDRLFVKIHHSVQVEVDSLKS